VERDFLIGRSPFPSAIIGRNSGSYPTGSGSGSAIANGQVNGVHARALPGGQLDAAGLVIPTIAVATISGASVIHPDGRVCSITRTNGYTSAIILAGNRLALAAVDAVIEFGPLPYAATVASTAWRTSNLQPGSNVIRPNGATGARVADGALGSTLGLMFYAEEPGNPDNSMIAYTRADRFTGWMPGDIRGAWICDATLGTLTGVNVEDRSYRNNPMAVVGSLTAAAVASGADLVALSGFSAANYLQQAYSSNLDFGTGDFCIIGWSRTGAAGSLNTGTLFDRRRPDGGLLAAGRITIARVANSGAEMSFGVSDGSSNFTINPTTSSNDGLWHLYVAVRRGTVLELWCDGVLIGTTSIGSVSITDAGATMVARIGAQNNGGALDVTLGNHALVRAAAYAPTPAQIARMFREERQLFQADAKAFLGGASNVVAALAQSEFSRRLAVATAAGVSLFSGLRRVEFLDTGIGAAIGSANVLGVSSEGGVDAFATAANAGCRRQVITGLDRMIGTRPPPRPARRHRQAGVAVDATPLVLSP
jgi:hypothetical protein